MKKYVLIIITAIIFTGVGVLATTAITADQVNYDENTTVKDKIDELYTKVDKGDLLIMAGDSYICTTTYTANISPIYFNNTYFSYNSSTKTYTALKDVNVTIYFAHEAIPGYTGAKVCLSKNGGNDCYHFDAKELKTKELTLKKDDTLVFLDKTDYAKSQNLYFGFSVIKN